jgi:Ribbon-helix-helix protein, copG family
MAIVKNPKRLRSESAENKAEMFISGADSADGADRNKKPTMIRVDPDLLARIDRAARRLGISRSAFIVSSAAEKLERMES